MYCQGCKRKLRKNGGMYWAKDDNSSPMLRHRSVYLITDSCRSGCRKQAQLLLWQGKRTTGAALVCYGRTTRALILRECPVIVQDTQDSSREVQRKPGALSEYSQTPDQLLDKTWPGFPSLVCFLLLLAHSGIVHSSIAHIPRYK